MSDLVKLAKSFEPFTKAEHLLLRLAPLGQLAWCGVGTDRTHHWDPGNDPTYAGLWDSDRWIRAALIRWLCNEPEAEKQIHSSGIAVGVCRIEGELDLSYLKIRFPLRLTRCFIPKGVNLYFTESKSLNFLSSWIERFDARRLAVDGNLLLGGKSRILGHIDLTDAWISGDLDCGGGSFVNPNRRAINAAGVRVGGSVRLGSSPRSGGAIDLFHADGVVDLSSAQIGADLNCEDACFRNQDGTALKVDGAKIDGGVYLRGGFRAYGEVNFVGTRIASDFHFAGAQLRNENKVDKKVALRADGVRVAGRVFFLHPFSAEGEVRLPGCEVEGELNCSGASFLNPSGVALSLEGARIGNEVYLNENFHSEGQVKLLGAAIGGPLNCTSGHFHNPGGIALWAQGAKIEGAVFLNDGFRAWGKVDLIDVRVGGTINGAHARLYCPDGKALDANGAKVDGNVFLNRRFIAVGQVDLIGAQIGNHLDCNGGWFSNPGGCAIAASAAKFQGGVFLGGDNKRRSFHADGEVSFDQSEIGASLICAGGQFFNSGKSALCAEGTRIQGHVSFRSMDPQNEAEPHRFVTDGWIRLNLAQIEGSVSFHHAQFIDGFGAGLEARNATVRGAFHWDKINLGPDTEVDVSRSTVGVLLDDLASWPIDGKLNLDGFEYESFGGQMFHATERLDWLKGCRDPHKPQPFAQIAKVFRQEGQDGATKVLIASSNARRELLGKSIRKRAKVYLLSKLPRCKTPAPARDLAVEQPPEVGKGLWNWLTESLPLVRAMDPQNDQRLRIPTAARTVGNSVFYLVGHRSLLVRI